MRMLLVTALLASGLSGCAALGEGEGVEVVASFYPLAYVAERVSGRPVELLTSPGAEPHDLELTVRETALVARGDLVVYEDGFQPSVDAAVEENAEGRVVDAADVADLQPAGQGDVDPHFWLDPARMADLGDAVADELADLDPDHRDEYLANAADLRTDLERLEAQYAAGLAHCERDTVVVSHDAFGYLERFGLHIEPVAGLSPEAEPTPADLSRLQDLIREEGITTVFSERLASPRLTQTLADDLGIETAVLDPIEGLSDETADEDYLSLMRQNLTALTEANGCRTP